MKMKSVHQVQIWAMTIYSYLILRFLEKVKIHIHVLYLIADK